MKTRLLVLGLAALCLSVAPARAGMFGDILNGGDALQGALDGMTTSPVLGTSSIDVYTDAIDQDAYWYNTGSGSVATIVLELAGYSDLNEFGIFKPGDPGTFLKVFDGSDGLGASRTIYVSKLTGAIWLDSPVGAPDATFAPGGLFGYYLDSSSASDGHGGKWYSDTAQNSDGLDHLYAYQGVGDHMDVPVWGDWDVDDAYYILCWEDLAKTYTDYDYTDMVLLVESVKPVPVPAAVLLGFLGLGAAGLKLRRFA